jgi:hypothetical protein
MADIVPHDLFRAMAAGEIVIGSHTFKAALFTSSATVDADNVGLSALGATQLSTANGYTSGGATVTVTVADSDGSNNVAVDSSDPSWTASGGSIGPFRYVVWYDDTHASDQIVYELDLGSDVTITTGNTWSVSVASGGLFTIAQV